MSSPRSISGSEPDTIVVCADGVEAILNRGPTGILHLNLKESFSEIREPLEGQSVVQTVEQIQRREIDRVCTTLREIQRQFSSQHSQEGDEIAGVIRNVTTYEQRQWRVAPDQISIAGFTTESEERLVKPNGISEASLLRASFDLIIADRIQAIQTIYQHVGRDLVNQRNSISRPALGADIQR